VQSSGGAQVEEAVEPVVSEPVVAEPVVAGVASGWEEVAQYSYSRSFTLEDFHAHECAAAEPAAEYAGTERVAEAVAAVAHVAEYESSAYFIVPEELIAPWKARQPEPFKDDVYVAEPIEAPVAEPVAKARPGRPLSFHELVGRLAEEPEAVTIHEPVPEEIAEWTQPVEEFAAPVVEIQEPVVAEAVAAPLRDPYAPPVTRDPYAPPSGTSRWDPIPPLRPNGSGRDWHGVVAEDARQAEDWSWTSHDHGKEDDVTVDENDEPALSRPWGLLSRFQQANLILPGRKPVVPTNGDGSGTETGADADWPGSFQPGSFKSGRKG
jgi:hypothetical protein